MKFIALVVSAAICFSGISLVDGSIQIQRERACCVKEELSGSGVMTDASGNLVFTVSDVLGRVNALNNFQPCDGRLVGMAPMTPAVSYAAKAVVATQAAVSAAASAPAAMAALWTAAGVTVASPPGSLSAPNVKQVYNVAALGTGTTSGGYHVALAANLGQNTGLALKAAVKPVSGSFSSFSALNIASAPPILPLEPLQAMAAAALPGVSGMARMAIATRMAVGGVRVARADVSSTLSATYQDSVAVSSAQAAQKLAVSSTLDTSYLQDVNGQVYMVSHALGTSRLLNVGSVALEMAYAGETMFGATPVQILATVERALRAELVLRAVDPTTMAVLSESRALLKAAPAEVHSLATLHSSIGSTFGRVMVVSRSDPRFCFWENQKHARLYRRCMKKCCESAEKGKIRCPRRCELEESCSDDCHRCRDYDDEFPRDEFDGAVVQDGYHHHHHHHGDCGCSSDTYDECRRCGDKRDLRECKCCCRRYLKRDRCCRSMTETFTYNFGVLASQLKSEL